MTDPRDPANDDYKYDDATCPECARQMEVHDHGAYRTEYKCEFCGYVTANDNIDEIRDLLNDE